VASLRIALLACKTIPVDRAAPIDPRRLLEARVVRKDTFVCKSTRGCGGSGNRCRIDRIATEIGEKRGRFTWGGGCSLWDQGTGKVKLPDRAPDPFRRRAELAAEVRERYALRRGGPSVGLSDEFQLKDLFPFFAAFLHGLGFDLVIRSGADRTALKRGIECANVSFCAPMQQFHGLTAALAEEDADQLFLPMLREVPRMEDEAHAVVCPIVQACPDLLRWDLPEGAGARIRSPVIDFGAKNFRSREFRESCRRAARELGAQAKRFRRAFEAGVGEQERFDAQRLQIGADALEFCRAHAIVPVVVLGRPYTIHNQVLNSNVPALLREQGAMAVPVDCYPVASGIAVLRDMYWAYGQRNLRAAEQVRATRGVYSIWCSNYSCGPDSFNLQFYRYLMEGKPFAVIETDGHAGDAGTKTRVEAFLHCVKEDLRQGKRTTPAASLTRIERRKLGMPEVVRDRPLVLVPRMGPGAEALAACLRGIGVPAEALPQPDRESVRLGRRHTSGKECVPMCITLGSLLQKLGRDGRNGRRYAFFMPTCNGPCRFGCYNTLHKITLERLGHGDRVGVWSPDDGDYFAGVAGGFSALVFSGFAAMDMLQEALYDVRPGAADPRRVNRLHARWSRALVERLEQAGKGDLSVAAALAQVGSGRLFGCASLLREAAAEFAALKTGREQEKPAVMVVGEIYVRSDPFANDFIIDKLERRGMRVRFAPFTEWLEYTDRLAWRAGTKRGFGARLSSIVQARIQARTYAILARVLDWPARTSVRRSVAAAAPYIREELEGEAILTVGGPIHEWRKGLIDGVVSVGPLECMPTRISQSQFFHVAEREGLPALTIPYNGDPLDPEILDNFLFEVRRTRGNRSRAIPASRIRPP